MHSHAVLYASFSTCYVTVSCGWTFAEGVCARLCTETPVCGQNAGTCSSSSKTPYECRIMIGGGPRIYVTRNDDNFTPCSTNQECGSGGACSQNFQGNGEYCRQTCRQIITFTNGQC